MIFRQRSHGVLALAFIGIGAFVVQGATQQAAPAAATAGAGKHFLWRVTDAPVPFYILGSIHSLRAKDYPIGAPIDQAIGECKRFLFEIDPVHTDAEAYGRKLRDAAQYPHGVTLRQKVSPKTYEIVTKLSKTRASSYENVKPWAIAMFMYGHPDVHDIFGYWGV